MEDERPVRRITYPLGQQVETPGENSVVVLDWQDDARWIAFDGGVVEPVVGTRFVRLWVKYIARARLPDATALIDALELEVEGGTHIDALLESYSSDQLASWVGREIQEGQQIEGWVYFEVPEDTHPAYAIFDCSHEQDGEGLWLRWGLPSKSGEREEADGFLEHRSEHWQPGAP